MRSGPDFFGLGVGLLLALKKTNIVSEQFSFSANNNHFQTILD
jgi:hypothetical protein